MQGVCLVFAGIAVLQSQKTVTVHFARQISRAYSLFWTGIILSYKRVTVVQMQSLLNSKQTLPSNFTPHSFALLFLDWDCSAVQRQTTVNRLRKS